MTFLVHFLEVSQASHLQEEGHNASIFLICIGKSFLHPFANIAIFIEIQSNTIGLHFKSSTFSWLFY